MRTGLIDLVVNKAKEAGVVEDDQTEVLHYGLIAGTHLFSGILLVMAVGLLLGTWRSMLLVCCIAVLFRHVSGGAHLNSPYKCLLYSVSAFTMAIWLGERLAEKIVTLSQGSQMFLALSGVFLQLGFGLLVVDLYVPVDHVNRPITNVNERNRFRQLSFLGVIAVSILFLCLVLFKSSWCISLAIFIVFFLHLISLTPVGLAWFRFISGLSFKEGADD